ncbi:VOC family protein [Amorphus sp. MBR-141]
MTYLVKQIGYVHLGVPDPAENAADLTDIVGLRVTGTDDGTVYMSSNTRQFEMVYSRTDAPCMISMGMEAVSLEAIDEVKRRALSDGLEIVSDTPTLPGIERAVTFVMPGGARMEVHAPVARSASAYHAMPGARPRRLEHVNLFVPDTAETADCITDILGMKLSDQTDGGALRWFRAEDGYHHSLALGPGEGRLHHYAFDLKSQEELARLADTLVARERTLFWGPGRHGAGGNIFTYYIDPVGCIVENSVEMDRIDHDLAYEPRIWDMSQGMGGRWINTWGTPPPENFLEPGVRFQSR